jgi:hypothetical protein
MIPLPRRCMNLNHWRSWVQWLWAGGEAMPRVNWSDRASAALKSWPCVEKIVFTVNTGWQGQDWRWPRWRQCRSCAQEGSSHPGCVAPKGTWMPIWARNFWRLCCALPGTWSWQLWALICWISCLCEKLNPALSHNLEKRLLKGLKI